VEEDRKPVGPWDKVQPQVELQALPCPSCKVSWKTSTNNLYALYRFETVFRCGTVIKD